MYNYCYTVPITQVRAVSQYMAKGPWSEAVCIPLPPVPSLTPEPDNTVTPQPPESIAPGE